MVMLTAVTNSNPAQHNNDCVPHKSAPRFVIASTFPEFK
jgi:hypothetical protein